MAAKKIEVSKVDYKAIDGIKWESPKSVEKFFSALGHTPKDSGVWATAATAAWAYGVACRSNNALGEPNTSPIADAYISGRILPGGPGALTADSEKTYRSVIRTLADTAYRLPYDSTPVRDFAALKLGSVAFGSRAKVVSDIAAAHPKACPTTDDMSKCVPVTTTNLSDDLAAIVTRLVNMAGDDATAKAINAHNLGGQFKAALASVKAFATASETVIPRTPKKARGKTVSPETAALLS